MTSKDQNTPDNKVLEEMEQQPQFRDTETKTTQEKINSYDARTIALEAQLAELQQNERNSYDSFLRAKAELENLRRRTELDIEKAHKFALEKFSYDLLPVIDNLERALEIADKNTSDLVSMIEGVELTLKSLKNVIYKYGIEIIGDINVPFNPDLHQAMTLIDSSDHEPNHVIMVMQKGYKLNGRLLRPAMVVVSNAPSISPLV